MYLSQHNHAPMVAFLTGGLWPDIKRCLQERRPNAPEVTDLPHVAAAKGFQRAAWDKMIEEIEKLAQDRPPAPPPDPFDRPALDTKD